MTYNVFGEMLNYTESSLISTCLFHTLHTAYSLDTINASAIMEVI